MRDIMRRCSCNIVKLWAKDPRIPIEFDKKLNEYSIVYRDPSGNHSLPLHHCPQCGGRLPKSRRDELFFKPSRSECRRLDRLLRGVQSVDAVVKVLGRPDKRYRAIRFPAREKAIYGYQDIKRSLIYFRLAKTVDVDVQEYDDGKIGISYVPKLKSASRRQLG